MKRAAVALVLVAAMASWGGVVAESPGVSQELPQGGDDRETAREYFTDLPLLTQEGKQVRFFSDVLDGRIVLINSFYTECTGITPRQREVLLQLQEMLGDSLGKDVFIVSITVDPERDTVEKLQEYVAGFEPRPGWIFLTGKPENVDWINHRLGQHLENLEEHQGVYMLGNVGTTLWMKVPAHGQPLDLYRAIQQLLADEGESANG